METKNTTEIIYWLEQQPIAIQKWIATYIVETLPFVDATDKNVHQLLSDETGIPVEWSKHIITGWILSDEIEDWAHGCL